MSPPAIPTPRGTAVLFGHEAAEAMFLELWRRNRLAHGWMLTGMPGIGKATLAYRLARSLLAGKDAAAAQHPEHPVFRMVAADAHPDLKVLERQASKTGRMRTEIVIDQVREVNEALRTTAAMGGRRVLLVDAADELNTESANALLKLLEEPPPQVVLLLVVQRPGRLPRTIASRCAILHLHPLGQIDLSAALSPLLPESAPLGPLQAVADGSPGRILRLLQSDWLGDYAALLELLTGHPRALASLPMAELLTRRHQAHGLELAIDPLSTLLRRAMRHPFVPGTAIVPGESEALAKVAALGLDRLLASWDALRDQSSRIERLNLDPLQTYLLLAELLLAPERSASQVG